MLNTNSNNASYIPNYSTESHIGQRLGVDQEQAEKQLTLLGYCENDTIYIRYLGAKVQPKNNAYKVHGQNKTCSLKRLPKHQNQNQAIYFVVNGQGQTEFVMKDGKRTDERIITHGRALTLEFDGISKDEQWQEIEQLKEKGFPEPTLIVGTRNSLHCYWVYSEKILIDDWKKMQTDMIAFVPKCDPCIKDAPRLMRLAGAWHTQIDGNTGEILEPFQCQIVGGSEQKYDFESLRNLVPFTVTETPKKTEKKELTFSSNNNGVMNDPERDRRLLVEVLDLFPSSANGDKNYHTYREIGLVVKNVMGETEALSIMENHSPGRDWEQILESSNGVHSMGSLIYHIRKEIPNWDYPEWWKKSPTNNVVHLTPKPQQKPLRKALSELFHEGLSGSILLAAQNDIADSYQKPLSNVQKLYQEIEKESDQQDDRENVRQDLNQLINTGNHRLNISDFLPKELAWPLELIAKPLGTTPEALLTILLPTIAASINPDCKLELWEPSNFYAKAIFWTGLIGEAGGAKTPTMNVIINPYKRLQYEEEVTQRAKIEAYEEELRAWKKLSKQDQKDNDEPTPPPPPREYFVQDYTSEALAKIQTDQPNFGLLIPIDELAGLIKSNNAYRGGKGSDAEKILSARTGEGIKINRADGRRMSSERSTYSITGGIQPDVLRQQMGDHRDSSGHFARFVYCVLPILPAPFIKGQQIPDVSEMLYPLYKDVGAIAPQTFKLSDAAQDSYINFANKLDDLKVNEPNQALRTVYGKSRGQVGEIALLLHLLWAAFYKQEPDNHVSLEIMESAIKLDSFYIEQIKSIYIKSGDADALTPKLSSIVELSQRKGLIAASVVKQSDRLFKNDNSDIIRGYFNELEVMGLGITEGTGRNLKFKVLKIDKIDKNRQEIDDCLFSESVDIQGFEGTTTARIDKIDKKMTSPITSDPLPLDEEIYKEASILSIPDSLKQETQTQQALDENRQDGDDCLFSSILSIPDFQVGDRVFNHIWGTATITEVDQENRKVFGLWSFQNAMDWAPFASLVKV